MPSFDFEFNNKDRNLIISQEGYDFTDLGETGQESYLNNFNYVRIIVFSNNNQHYHHRFFHLMHLNL